MLTLLRVISLFCISLVGTMAQATPPTISTIKWGQVSVIDPDGSTKTYKDCKLFPTGSVAWDWRLTGTQHEPGIQVADFEEFINDVDIVILSAGMDKILRVQDATINFLKSKNKEYFFKETREAVALYNELVSQGKKVGALIHSTC